MMCLMFRWARSKGATSRKVESRSGRGTRVEPPKPGLESGQTWKVGKRKHALHKTGCVNTRFRWETRLLLSQCAQISE